MRSMGTAEGRVIALKRLRNSTMGNPAWQLTLHDGRVYRTGANVSCAYTIADDMIGQYVELTLNGRGSVTAYRFASPAPVRQS